MQHVRENAEITNAFRRNRPETAEHRATRKDSASPAAGGVFVPATPGAIEAPVSSDNNKGRDVRQEQRPNNRDKLEEQMPRMEDTPQAQKRRNRDRAPEQRHSVKYKPQKPPKKDSADAGSAAAAGVPQPPSPLPAESDPYASPDAEATPAAYAPELPGENVDSLGAAQQHTGEVVPAEEGFAMLSPKRIKRNDG